MSNQTFILVSLSLIAMCSGHIGGHISIQDIKDTKPQKYCGPNLAKTLALLCYDENSGDIGKRAGRNFYNAIHSNYHKKQDVPIWPWMPAEISRNLGLSTRRKRYVGVVDECCFKACSVDELMSYC